MSRGGCCVPGCRESVDLDAPLPLCATHLAIAADWSTRIQGVTDLLPSPCLACGSRLGMHYPSGWVCAVCEWRYGEVPDDDVPPPRVDVVYYLRYGDRVKIGTTANPGSGSRRSGTTRCWLSSAAIAASSTADTSSSRPTGSAGRSGSG
jgi:hypothetical protein